MLDGSELPPEEQRKEEIKFEIKNLFDDLELNTSDPNLRELHAWEKKFSINLLGQPDETKELPEEVTLELRIYFRLLEIIADDQYKDPIEQSKALSRVAVSHAKIYYDLGKKDIAFDILDNPDDGAVVQAWNASSWSEEHEKIHKGIRRLSALLYKLLK